MAEIAPFKGIRYNRSLVGDLSKVTCPPYDIISPTDNTYYQELHPNNFVRLILGDERAGDNDADNRYTRASGYLEKWIGDGVLDQDQTPSIYIYEQQFERDDEPKTVRGIMCAVKLHPYADRVVLPHENTLAKPKSHLAPLIRAVKSNLDCVYGLYADEQHRLDEILDAEMNAEPAADVVDRDGVRHLLWAITDEGVIARIVEFLKDKQIAIADGHHRYETALAYAEETHEKGADYILMTIANVFQEDLTVLPTHRVVGNVPNDLMNGLVESLSALFEVKKSSRQSILTDMKSEGAIGMYGKSGAFALKLKADPNKLLSGSEASRNLELNVLHKLALERSLGINDEKLRNQTNIIYMRSADEAMDLVDSGERQLAFLLNEMSVKSVLDIAAADEKMPQKATYFYPKLLSGLALRKMD
ncbi:MAG: DUF1015 domain-containing protein [Armatimonadetes bacterium]|nr:DUF1015 domain-containing protein [Armatimonadota bacterium]